MVKYMIVFLILTVMALSISIILIWYTLIYNKFQNYIIKINEAEANIDATLRKRFDLLNKSIGVIKANTPVKGDVLELIVKF